MTGYQEILTDPSYAGQIITFTFPHIGNVGTNAEDIESDQRRPRAAWCCAATSPSRPTGAPRKPLDDWLKSHDLPGICRRRHARADPPHPRRRARRTASSPIAPDGKFDIAALRARGARLARARRHGPRQGGHLPADLQLGRDARGRSGTGYGKLDEAALPRRRGRLRRQAQHPAHASPTHGCRVTVVPATATAEDILRHKPDGMFLSNGPGDPAATGEYAVPVIAELIDSGHADVRHLPRPSDAGAGAGRQDARRWSAAIAAPTTRSRT